MVLGTNSGTTPCPECGKSMGLVSWVGEKPVCASCAGATTTGVPDLGSGLDFDSDESCLHDGLDDDATHMIACPCPKCSPRC